MTDFLIATHPYTLKLTSMTNNICEFSRNGVLKIDNWKDVV